MLHISSKSWILLVSFCRHNKVSFADTAILKILPLPLHKTQKYAALYLLEIFPISVPEKTECLKGFWRVNLGRGISAQGSESKFEDV